MSVDQDTRNEIERWMRHVIETSGLTASAWAEKANVAGTSITRFLSAKGDGFIPSMKTIGRLAAVVGSQPEFIAIQPVRHVPQLQTEEIIYMLENNESFAGLSKEAATIPVDTGVTGTRAFAAQLETASMAGMGLNKGDTIIVDPDETPQTDSLVAVIVDGKLNCYRYAPPQLIPYGIGGGFDVIPITPDLMMAGVVKKQVRDLSSLF